MILKPPVWGPGFKGRDTRSDVSVSPGAEVSLDTRRDRGTLEGVWPATLIGTDGTHIVRGIAYHQGGDNVSRRLSASGGRVYLNGVEQKSFSGATVTTADRATIFAQLESRTYFVDGTNALRYFDADATEPNTIATIVLPTAPTAPTGSVLTVPGKAVDAFDSITGWVALGGLSGLNVDPSPLGGSTLHIDTTGSLAIGDTAVKTVTAQDWSAYPFLEFDIFSGGNENVAGSPYNFICGESAATDNVIPFVIPQAKVKQTIRIPLWNIAKGSRDAITKYGLQAATDSQSVIWFSNLRFVSGITGTKQYVITATDEQSSGNAEIGLQSPESPQVEIETGDDGKVARLALPPPAVGVDNYKIWRIDITPEGDYISTRYHYVDTVPIVGTFSAAVISGWLPTHVYGANDKVVATVRNGAYWTTTAGGTSAAAEPAWRDADGNPLASVTDGTVVWTLSGTHADWDDLTFDVTSNPLLAEVRTGPPIGAECVGADRRRVMLGKGSDVWWGNADDPTTFYDVTPQDALELGMEDGDGGRFAMGSRVVAFANQSITTSGIIEGATFIFTEDDIVRITGDTMLDVDISWRKASGLSGPYGWTRDNLGAMYWFDSTGDVRLMDSGLNIQTISGDMAESFRDTDASTRDGWVMVFEPQTHRLLCFITGHNCHALHMAAPGGWDDLTVSPSRLVAPYSAAISGSGDAAIAVIAGADGVVQGAVDTTPGYAPCAWTYQTNQVDYQQIINIVEASGRVVSGDATVTVSLDGQAISTFQPTGRFREKFAVNAGHVLSVMIQGASGCVVRDISVLPAARGRL